MAFCYQCGMACGGDTEYHPYAACLMFKQTGDGEAVKSNLAAVLEQGGKVERARIRRELLQAFGELEEQFGDYWAVRADEIRLTLDRICPEEG